MLHKIGDLWRIDDRPEPPHEPPLTVAAARDFINGYGHATPGSPPLPWNHCLRCLAERLLSKAAYSPRLPW
jgi:hypothetical protein